MYFLVLLLVINFPMQAQFDNGGSSIPPPPPPTPPPPPGLPLPIDGNILILLILGGLIGIYVVHKKRLKY